MWRFCILLGFLARLSASAKQEEMDSGNITFEAPDDFTPLTPQEIDVKFPHHNGPIEAVGSPTRGASISYTVTANAVRPEQLDDFERYMETALPKLAPTMQWITKDSRTINGTKWIYFEFTTPDSTGSLIHNIELFTSYHGVLTILNFNASAPLFNSYEQKLRDGVNSIKIRGAPGV
jgi:hypothetical protein